MKAEGSNVPIVLLQKVKVKEEAKECNLQQRSPISNDRVNGGIAIINSIVTNSSGLPTSTITTSTTVSNNSPTTTTSSISLSGANGKSDTTGLLSTAINATTTSTFSSREPLPIDLKSKVVSSQQSIQQREKLTRDDGSHDEHHHHLKDNRSSPNSYHKTKAQQQQQQLGINGQLSSSSSSSENDSPNSLHSIKPENEDVPSVGSKQNDENTSGNETSVTTGATSTGSNSSSSGGGGGGSSSGLRCISSVFAGHTKLKRLLGTLVQFANNISTETGDTVRTLVLNVLSGGLTAEEFHTALQDATNFPLRDFVLPYLRHTLPTLRRNLNAAATANSQSCVQYLRSNESALLETVSLIPSGETVEPFREQSNNNVGNCLGNSITNYGLRSNSSNIGTTMHHTNSSSASLHHYGGATNLATKRRASDTPYYETGLASDESPVYGKRPINSWNHHQQQQQQTSDSYCWYHPLHSSGGTIQSHSQSHGHGANLVPPNLVQINQLSSFNASAHASQQQHMTALTQNGSSLDDEWKNIHVMLNCILGMVDKTKRALVILQRRGCSSPASTSPHTPGLNSTQNVNGNSNGNATTTATNGGQIEPTVDRDGNLKRLSGEIVAQTIRATEDRVAAEVKRRTEEAVQEVKRAAMAEVQRAVAAAVAESRANERLRVHQLLDLPLAQRNHGHTRQSAFLRINNHINSGVEMTTKTSVADDDKEGVHLTNVVRSSCWNCGRPALETCGGCGIARYCGSFCQHRDWEAGGHHATCNANPPGESPRSVSRSPPRITNNVNANNGDADIGNANSPIITKEK